PLRRGVQAAADPRRLALLLRGGVGRDGRDLPVAAPEPHRRGRLRPVPRAARGADRGRLDLAALADVAVRQGVEGAAPRDPVGPPAPLRVHPGARAPDAPAARCAARPGAAPAGRRAARFRRAADVLDRLPALALRHAGGGAARRPAGRPAAEDPVGERPRVLPAVRTTAPGGGWSSPPPNGATPRRSPPAAVGRGNREVRDGADGDASTDGG